MPHIVDIDQGNLGNQAFWDSNVAVINIPYKNVGKYAELVRHIENTSIKNLIFVSSTSVYGPKIGAVSEENVDCLVHSSLLEIESLFQESTCFETTVVRFAGLVGYSRNPALFFKGNKEVPNPDHRVNMIHRDDCINILDGIISKRLWGEVFNGCADTHPTKRQFYTHAAQVSNKPVPRFGTTGSGPDKVIDNTKIKKYLDYQFVHSDLLRIPFGSEA